MLSMMLFLLVVYLSGITQVGFFIMKLVNAVSWSWAIVFIPGYILVAYLFILVTLLFYPR